MHESSAFRLIAVYDLEGFKWPSKYLLQDHLATGGIWLNDLFQHLLVNWLYLTLGAWVKQYSAIDMQIIKH